jgi:hypothetical protein
MGNQKDYINLPTTEEGAPVPIMPAGPAIATHYEDSISTSTALTLDGSTSIVEITSLKDDIFCRWGATAAALADDSFDFCLAAGTEKAVVVPEGQTTLQIIDSGNDGIATVVEK